MEQKYTEHVSAEILASEAKKYWQELKDKELKMKDRAQIPVQEMPTLDPKERATLMDEVAMGYTVEQAQIEANRCLNCKNEPCVKGCPVGVRIPEFIMEIQKGNFKASVDIIKTTNLLPAICGRVCPQEKQCQLVCTVGKMLKSVEKSVAIGRLERFVADWEREQNQVTIPECAPPTGKKVAVIGSGPAGLTVAADTARAGHEVTVFEAFHKTGGVMVYGIPEFRLPKEIVAKETDNLKKMGVQFKMNFLVGRTATIDQLFNDYKFDAVFIGSGAGLPRFMNIEGEDLIGVFSANEYLTRANLMKAYEHTKADTPLYPADTIAVIGGGNVAMDAARMGLRLGAKKVYCIYRRTRNEMPARLEEIAHAEEEGVEFKFLQNPTRIIGDEDGRVIAVEVLDYTLGEPDESGRRSPVPIEGTEHKIPVDAIIVALGNSSNPLMSRSTKQLEVNKYGNIVVDENQKTSLPAVWAGGDIVLGASTVILAMGEGRKAAASINEYLTSI
ncbi:NADPH-dependent glutamate synthase [Treponema phagedenis]|uniref:NADPH-dependent glutamate synthase n=1 Tax=Treponema phagedenis TaxID=162 RepID=A0A0B7GTF1_TREPH|nr:NADPH-dependent glutamate synthase [Treponema phagedenis]NVP22792.1 NADPH-dependent glutamate synthase [Treponema phagedenis]QEJ95254.1 NADPH-dependent glutamate synthase [Treponema phagedenis]QEJ98357.1 NADPH-dependent glutamate synthase [Treponema phagedenis]QEK01108.1 NADPH-dependent glutamate synthase [Treponema phagedenis]QEK03867.1 NADPH-dependent glutamate synthase [Treponema phagedenis]